MCGLADSSPRLPMPKIIGTHAVVDVEPWLSGKAERAAAIESWSGSNVTDFVAEDGSDKIGVTPDIADLETMKALMAFAISRGRGHDGEARCGPPSESTSRRSQPPLSELRLRPGTQASARTPALVFTSGARLGSSVLSASIGDESV